MTALGTHNYTRFHEAVAALGRLSDMYMHWPTELGPPSGTVDFLARVPVLARRLPDYITRINVADATASDFESEEACYDLMQDTEARDAEYTFYFLLA